MFGETLARCFCPLPALCFLLIFPALRPPLHKHDARMEQRSRNPG
jgi:hypothetical protein